MEDSEHEKTCVAMAHFIFKNSLLMEKFILINHNTDAVVFIYNLLVRRRSKKKCYGFKNPQN